MPPREAASPGRDEAENRRPATILFADLAGFTAISERLDPEDVRAFQNDLFREMAAGIERYEGFVEKYVGDAVMAIFGAPVAHEDDPERALHAALALHERMAVLNAGWAARLGREVALHVGVNTGRVVAGHLGGPDAAYAVTGDTVNTAARLQSAARGGQTLVSHATYLLTRHVFVFEPLEPLSLKGKAEPVPVYRLVGAAARRRSARGLEAEGLAAPLIGRDGDLAEMLGAFERAAAGRAQVVSLVGDVGAGKSRLLAEFLARLESEGRLAGATVRQAACSSLGEPPYGIIATFFREGYGVAPDDPLPVAREKIATGLQALGVAPDEAAGVTPILGYVLGLEVGGRLPDIDPETVKRQIFLLVRMALERRLSQGPLLLVVEDLHWADAASLAGLKIVADWLADRRLMIVVTFRPTFDAEAIATSQATPTTLRLSPLGPDDSTAILAAFFGPAMNRIPSALSDVIVKRAGGNPFYLEEIVRDLIATGVLARADGGWLCNAAGAPADVPSSLQGVLLARVDRLPAAVRRVLQEAAVLGPVFEPRVLREVMADPAACDAALDHLREAELLEQGSSDRPLAFTHALVQEVVYQNVLVRRRTELHGRVGEVLERLRGERPSRLEDLEALGHHFGLSEEKRKGARYMVAAGEWARGVYANDDAIRHFERALDTLQHCDDVEAERLTVRERLGDLLGLAGQRDKAAQHYEMVRRAAEAGGDPATAARQWRKLAGLQWDAGERDQAVVSLDTGLRLLAADTEDIELAHLYQEMGRLAFRSGDNQRAMEWAERALARAEQVASQPAAGGEARKDAALAVAHALNTLGVALARLGDPAAAVARIERSVAVAQEHGLLNVACRSYANLGVLYSELDPGRSIETCLTGLETAKRIGDLGFQSRLYANLAVAYCALTDRCDDDGVRAAEAAIDLDRRLGQVDHLAVPLIVLAQIYQCHGEPDRALAYYQEALVLAEEIGEPQLLFPCYDGLGTVHLDKGNRAEAEHYLVKAEAVCEQAGGDRDSLVVLPFLC
ncbi:MAG TPA: adenylate/guanylate cyclase domain-containing protein [Candidatus Limnocylindrales bacterium]|nr:adenylate/guanylate cyclase domain-containing protein [Candidatus Limnocylindrales bacterium]